MDSAIQTEQDTLTDPRARERMLRRLAHVLLCHQLGKIGAEKRAELSRQNPLWKLPNWVGAYTRLLELLPAAHATILTPGYMGLDRIWDAAKKSGFSWETRAIAGDTLWWQHDMAGSLGTKCWDEYEDEEVLDLIFGEFPLTPGPVWFIPDDCFYGQDRLSPTGRPYTDGPFYMQAEELREFVAESRDYLIARPSSDTVFIWCESPRIIMTNHDGWLQNLIIPVGQDLPVR